MKYILITALIALSSIPFNQSFAAHKGYVVCENTYGDPDGDDCFTNWDTGGIGLLGGIQRVARRITNLYGSGCVPIRHWPDQTFGCELDLNDTFDVCRTSSGPCYRHTYKISTVIPADSTVRASPSGTKIDARYWVTYSAPSSPRVWSEWMGCVGGSPVFGVTINGSGSRDTEFFEVEKYLVNQWINILDDYETCIPSDFPLYTDLRVRALNLDGESNWLYHSVYSSYFCESGDVW